MEEMTVAGESPMTGLSQATKRKVEIVEMMIAATLVPIKPEMRVVSKCSRNHKTKRELLLPSSASTWNLYLLRQAKAVSVAL